MPTVALPAAVLEDSHYASILNFFYFLLLDEGLAINASYKTAKMIQKKLKEPIEGVDHVLISTMSEVFHKYQKRHDSLKTSTQPPKSDWKIPDLDAMGAWKEFMRRATDDSPEALVLRYVLQYPVKTISEGLNIPEGTVYFRLGRGLENFSRGAYLQSLVKK